VLAEVAHGGPLGNGVLDQAAGGAGDDHLAAVGRPGDPGRPVHVDADVVVPAQHPLAGVQAHPHPHREPLRPPVGGQAPLGRHRGPDRRPRAGEDGEERVALGADLDPLPVPDGPAQEGRVLVPDRRVASAQLLEQPGRALDVGEQEGDGPGRQLRDLGPARRPWPVGGEAGRGAACGAAACRRRRSSRPDPSSMATTPSSATTLHRMPAGEPSGWPDPTHSAAATATAITPLSRVVAITPGLPARSAAGPSRSAGGRWSPPCLMGRYGTRLPTWG
jgi:hypothetical protein